MFSAWFIAIVISGGAAGWIYNKMYRRNGNQRDTLIAAGIIWLIGFIVLFLILHSLHI